MSPKQIIIACLNSVASVNPAVLIDRAERGLRKMVKDETHDRLTSTVSFWSSIGFYSLCSSSMLLVNKMVLARLPYASTLSLIQICAAVVFIQIGSYGNVLGVICVRPERRRREVCPRAPIPLARAALGTRPPAVGPRAV